MSCSCSQDILGRRILVGLTYAETCEFERLSELPPIDEFGQLLPWETDENSFPPSEWRWLELYKKHLRSLNNQRPNDQDV
jgi:hypothetical protein